MRKVLGMTAGIIVGAITADALIRREESVAGRLISARRERSTVEPATAEAEAAPLRGADETNSALHDGCREEVLAAARRLHEDGHADFSPAEMIRAMQASGTRYAESTIRTHVISRMCADAPDNHGTTYDDLERVERGRYRLRNR